LNDARLPPSRMTSTSTEERLKLSDTPYATLTKEPAP